MLCLMPLSRSYHRFRSLQHHPYLLLVLCNLKYSPECSRIGFYTITLKWHERQIRIALINFEANKYHTLIHTVHGMLRIHNGNKYTVEAITWLVNRYLFFSAFIFRSPVCSLSLDARPFHRLEFRTACDGYERQNEWRCSHTKQTMNKLANIFANLWMCTRHNQVRNKQTLLDDDFHQNVPFHFVLWRLFSHRSVWLAITF